MGPTTPVDSCTLQHSVTTGCTPLTSPQLSCWAAFMMRSDCAAYVASLGPLGFAPSTADWSLFLRTDPTPPPFYILVYVDDFVFATADTEALTLVKAELQKRHPCTDLGPSALRLSVLLATAHSSAYRPVALSSTFGRVLHQARGLCLEDGVQCCEAEIYAAAMAAQELRWLTYVLTNLGERPCSRPVVYVDNKAMIALC
ncbi:unnamed protein product [Closterium sp. NIES-53]